MMRNIYPAFTELNDIDPADLSTDSEVGKAYTADPLVHSKITAGMFFSAFEAGNWALDHANELQIKTLVMHGSEDKLTSAEGSVEFVKNTDGIATFQSWEGMRHEPHNEPGDSVATYVAGWIQGINHQEPGGVAEPVTT
jgi:alpha-beta hydrolase superfamily lysophospholipase